MTQIAYLIANPNDANTLTRLQACREKKAKCKYDVLSIIHNAGMLRVTVRLVGLVRSKPDHDLTLLKPLVINQTAATLNRLFGTTDVAKFAEVLEYHIAMCYDN